MRYGRGAVAASTVLLGALALGGCASSLDTAKLQSSIQAKLGEVDLSASNISCPSSIEVKAGSTFDCTATVNGVPAKVTVTQKDDQGNVSFEVDRKVVYVIGDGVTLIQQAIRDQGATDVTVTCPKAVALPDGNGTISCTAVADGQSLKVTVPVTGGSAGVPEVQAA